MGLPWKNKKQFTSKRFGEAEDLPRRTKARFFSLTTILIGVFYISWAERAANPHHPVLVALFLLAEAFCLLLFVLATVGLWKLRFKPPTGLQSDKEYTIDIFITTCGEPLEYIRATIHAASLIRYSHPLNYYVLDDAGRDAVEALAHQYGFNYLSRLKSGAPKVNAKAGNLNFGLRHSHGELILVIDADQVVSPEILKCLVGYMKFPQVAFIQSKQSYLTQESDPFYNKSQVFYDTIQLGMDNNDTVLSCGSGVLYRRSALESLGGFVEWNLVEDLITSYELHAHGWKSFYFPHALSRGLAPASIKGVYQQRGQWALDTMRLFFWDNPFLKKGLSFFTRLQYSTVALSYVCATFVFPLFYLIPIWSYLSGETILLRSEIDFLILRTAYLVSMVLATH